MQALVAELGLAVHDQWITGDAVVSTGDGRRRVPGPVTPPAFRFSNGAASLAEAMAARLPDGMIRTDSPVGRISVADRHLVVETVNGPIRAGAAVVAVPPSVAIGAGIVTAAELGDDGAAVAEVTPTWMGAIAKAVVLYDRAFWRDDGLSGTAIDQGGPLQEMHDMSGPDGTPAALFGFASVIPGGQAPTEDDVVAQLTRLFGPSAGSPRQVMIRSWPDEPLSTLGPPNVRYNLYGSQALTRPYADGRLVLASTESATTAPGHIEGALQAAERAVSQLVGSGRQPAKAL